MVSPKKEMWSSPRVFFVTDHFSKISCQLSKVEIRMQVYKEEYIRGRRSAPQQYTYSSATNVEYTLSCTRPDRLVAWWVGVPHHKAAGRLPWPQTGES